MSKVISRIQRWRAEDRAASGAAPGGRKAHIDDSYTKQELPMQNEYTGKEVDKPVL